MPACSAGVKLVCVAIHPAVVTKLSDRGSLESVGGGYRCGPVLSLLVQQLDRLERGWTAPAERVGAAGV
jgi:hypothetical protein